MAREMHSLGAPFRESLAAVPSPLRRFRRQDLSPSRRLESRLLNDLSAPSAYVDATFVRQGATSETRTEPSASRERACHSGPCDRWSQGIEELLLGRSC